MIHMAMTEFGNAHQDFTVAPMAVCSAMSQGYIGYDLQNEIRTELLRRGIFNTVSTIITQVKVDPFDHAFSHPLKSIGRIMTAEQAQAERDKGNFVREEEGGFAVSLHLLPRLRSMRLMLFVHLLMLDRS